MNGSPAGSGDKCSEQVLDRGVTGMLLPPRVPGALDWSMCTHEGLGWEEMGQPGTRTADCPGSVDDSHQGTFKSVQQRPSQTLTCKRISSGDVDEMEMLLERHGFPQLTVMANVV